MGKVKESNFPSICFFQVFTNYQNIISLETKSNYNCPAICRELVSGLPADTANAQVLYKVTQYLCIIYEYPPVYFKFSLVTYNTQYNVNAV